MAAPLLLRTRYSRLATLFALRLSTLKTLSFETSCRQQQKKNSKQQPAPLPVLPPSLIAKILSYNLHDLVDLARLRELNQVFGPLAISLVSSLAPKSGHFLQASNGTSGFVRHLLEPTSCFRELGWNQYDFMYITAELDEDDDEYYDDYYPWNMEHYLTRLWDHYQYKPVREGVAIVDGVVSADLQLALNEAIGALAQKQEQEDMVDYHPNSSDVVRDLVHPALYSYISGVSPVAKLPPLEPCTLPSLEQDVSVASGAQRDFWGRKYEDSTYQWLPTTFSVDQDGTCTIEDYINNLTPREDHRNFYGALSKLFEQCLPFVESVYAYIGSIRPLLRTDDDEVEYDGSPLTETRDQKYVSFRGQKLQVITKIVDYELQPGQTHDGVWHVEGMSHEEIVMTCLYILDRDDAIEGGNLEYKRAFLSDEAAYIFSLVDQMRPQSLDKMIPDGLKKLGTVETQKARLIVFPNSHVHRVTDMVNKGPTLARRRIVVFFLVNPLRRIISAREVTPQQMNAAGVDGSADKKQKQGCMTLEEAKKHRLELMKERKYTKQDWNVRDIHLCEH